MTSDAIAFNCERIVLLPLLSERMKDIRILSDHSNKSINVNEMKLHTL